MLNIQVIYIYDCPGENYEGEQLTTSGFIYHLKLLCAADLYDQQDIIWYVMELYSLMVEI